MVKSAFTSGRCLLGCVRHVFSYLTASNNSINYCNKQERHIYVNNNNNNGSNGEHEGTLSNTYGAHAFMNASPCSWQESRGKGILLLFFPC